MLKILHTDDIVIDVFCPLVLTGLVHVGDELREVNGVSVIHKRPDEISQLLVRQVCCRFREVLVCIYYIDVLRRNVGLCTKK